MRLTARIEKRGHSHTLVGVFQDGKKAGVLTVQPSVADKVVAHINETNLLVAATAVSLYAYNVSPLERARKLNRYFDGDCADVEHLVEILVEHGENWATEFPVLTAQVYLLHALQVYEDEAEERVRVNIRNSGK